MSQELEVLSGQDEPEDVRLIRRSPQGRTTDLANGRRLAMQHVKTIRWCEHHGCWYVWDGRRWARDSSGAIVSLARDTVGRMYERTRILKDPEKRADWVSAVIKCETRKKIDSMIWLARSEHKIPISPDELDRDPWLLNVLNGTIDLRTGRIHEHERGELLTKLAPVCFNADAKAPVFEQFLRDVTAGHEDLADFLRRVVGYVLTGDISEHCLFFLWGTGRNGKSTFLKLFLELLGDYAKTSAPDLIFVQQQKSHPTEKADLAGARMIATIEGEQGQRMAESLVKALTGGDRIKARFMREDFFEFAPTHKLFLASNHKPVIRGTDTGIWSRVRLIPFTVRIPDEFIDKHLDEKLRQEMPGILNWAIRGCLEWQRNGLQPPAEVTGATEGYRAESDVIGAFFADCVLEAPSVSCLGKDAYKAYEKWASEAGEYVLSRRKFAEQLRERGIEEFRGTGGNLRWKGLCLKVEEAEDERTWSQ